MEHHESKSCRKINVIVRLLLWVSFVDMASSLKSPTASMLVPPPSRESRMECSARGRYWMSPRGGSEEEDAMLDDYVNQLIAGLDSSSFESEDADSTTAPTTTISADTRIVAADDNRHHFTTNIGGNATTSATEKADNPPPPAHNNIPQIPPTAAWNSGMNSSRADTTASIAPSLQKHEPIMNSKPVVKSPKKKKYSQKPAAEKKRTKHTTLPISNGVTIKTAESSETISSTRGEEEGKEVEALTDESESISKRRNEKQSSSSEAIATATPSSSMEESTDSTAPTVSHSTTTVPLQQHPLAKPPRIYRFLLTRGPFAHKFVIFFILVSQLLQRYLPELYHVMYWIVVRLRIYDPKPPKPQPQKDGPAATSKLVVSSGPQWKKASRAQVRKADEVAIQKLKGLGNINNNNNTPGRSSDTSEVKYRYLSKAFMQRYNLGIYATEKQRYEEIMGVSPDAVLLSSTEIDVSPIDSDEEEENDDWVVNALTGSGLGEDTLEDVDSDIVTRDSEEIDDNRKNLSGAVKPSTDGRYRRIGADRNSFSVGVSLNSKSLSKSSMLEAAAASRNNEFLKQRSRRPRGSDRNGGGGVLGRLRAAGAGNVMSSYLLGAYPGDAVPVEEAGSARGVLELARRYGYGDWSDDDEEGATRKRRKRRSSSKHRQRTSVQHHPKDEHDDDYSNFLGTGLGSGLDPKMDQNRKRRKSTTTRESTSNDRPQSHTSGRSDLIQKSMLASSPLSFSPSRFMSSSSSSSGETLLQTAAQPPMKRMGYVFPKGSRIAEDVSRRATSSSSSRVRAPMSRWNEARERGVLLDTTTTTEE